MTKRHFRNDTHTTAMWSFNSVPQWISPFLISAAELIGLMKRKLISDHFFLLIFPGGWGERKGEVYHVNSNFNLTKKFLESKSDTRLIKMERERWN